MAIKVYALVRFFKTEAHRETFLRGDLYMNRLKYFKIYEEEDPCNIGDRHEGTSGWFQPDEVRFKITNNVTGEEHILKDFAGPIVMGMNHHNDYHVYCMSALYTETEARFESLEAAKACIMLDVETGDLGNYCTIVDASPFMARLDKALRGEQTEGCGHGRGMVEYFDPKTFSGSFDGDLAIFRKKNCFSHQKEFRVFVYDGTTGDDPKVFSIGDLSDIALNCHKSDLNVLISAEMSKHHRDDC